MLCFVAGRRRGRKKSFELWVLGTLATAVLNSASKIPSARFSIIAIRSAVIIFVAILKASCDAHFRSMDMCVAVGRRTAGASLSTATVLKYQKFAKFWIVLNNLCLFGGYFLAWPENL